MKEVNLCNVYGQEHWHAEAFLVVNKEALLALRAAIDNLLQEPEVEKGIEKVNVFSSEDEGYNLYVIRADTNVGMHQFPNKVWNQLACEYNSDYIEVKREGTISPYDLLLDQQNENHLKVSW